MTKDEIIAQVGQLAERYYQEDQYSCAEAMLKAIAEVFTPDLYDPRLIPRLATPFNGGFAELKSTCGVLTGGLLSIGLVAGRDQPGDEDAKEEAYTLAQIYHQRFMARTGSDSCATLLERWKEQGIQKTLCKRHTKEMSELLAQTILQVGFHQLLVDEEPKQAPPHA
ncbi:MAG: C_GCAxxG_C_C family protein [Magnetococcales bacterium]|nr:C_GCAxxG_C_C family protein [Magnetococcales bacterium]NGZ26426.1 C_GCAxxG_C_C family protein [Magnetococcales bacterium]